MICIKRQKAVEEDVTVILTASAIGHSSLSVALNIFYHYWFDMSTQKEVSGQCKKLWKLPGSPLILVSVSVVIVLMGSSEAIFHKGKKGGGGGGGRYYPQPGWVQPIILVVKSHGGGGGGGGYGGHGGGK